MSIVFTAICLHPIRPADERRLLAAGKRLPFEVTFEALDAWRDAAVTGPDAEDPDRARWLPRAAAVVTFRTRPGNSTLAGYCADELVTTYGGVFYDDTSWQLSEARPGAADRKVQQVLDGWSRLVAKDPVPERPLAAVTVFCARAIDGEARALLGCVRAPFALRFEDGDTWRATTAANESGGPFRSAPAQRYATVVHLLARDSAAVPVALECAHLLSVALGGIVHDGASWTTSEAQLGSPRATVKDVVSCWIGVFNAAIEPPSFLDRREHADAKKEWAVKADRDATVAVDNDWSDV